MLKKLRKPLALISALALAAAVFASCNSSSNPSSSSVSMYNASGTAADGAYEAGADVYTDENKSSAQAPGVPELTGLEVGPDLPDNQRKMVLTAYLELETKEFDQTIAGLWLAADVCGGYRYTSSLGGSEGSRYANITLKIPAEYYTSFIDNATDSGVLLSREEQTDDITDSYVDVESRLKSLRTQESRLLTLMEESGNLKDLLTVQEALSEVQYEIERYTATMRSYENQVAYSTVNIYIREVREISAVTIGFGSRLGNAFAGGWRSALSFVQNLLVGIAEFLPFLLFLAVVVIAAVVVYKKSQARRERERQNEEPQPPPAVKPDER